MQWQITDRAYAKWPLGLLARLARRVPRSRRDKGHLGEGDHREPQPHTHMLYAVAHYVNFNILQQYLLNMYYLVEISLCKDLQFLKDKQNVLRVYIPTSVGMLRTGYNKPKLQKLL